MERIQSSRLIFLYLFEVIFIFANILRIGGSPRHAGLKQKRYSLYRNALILLFVVQSCLMYTCIFCVNICTFLVTFGYCSCNSFIACWLKSVRMVTGTKEENKGRGARNKCFGWRPWEGAEGRLKLHTPLGAAEFKGRICGKHMGTASCAMAVRVQSVHGEDSCLLLLSRKQTDPVRNA